MKHNQIKLFRRRQFILGPEYISYEGWKKISLEEKFLFTVHPDLTITTVRRHRVMAILLGYVVDVDHPDLDDESILQRFIREPITLNSIRSELDNLSGRFVVIVKFDDNLWLFHDAVALRQVQYCRDNNGFIWCASQAESLSERLGYKYDEEVLRYRNIAACQAGEEEFWMIHDLTPYREIHNLLPNHYLDLRKQTSFRYWPVAGCIRELSIDESIQQSNIIMQNSIRAAARRFSLKMGITAGGDSRKSLAASREVKDKIYFYTHTPRLLKGADAIISTRLLSHLGIEHHSLELKQMDPDFRNYYERSSTWGRERRGNIAYSVLIEFGPDTTILNSNISEFSQCIYWLPPGEVTGEDLAIITGLNHPLVIREFQKWLDGAKGFCDAANMNILDLFFLELRQGRWATATFCESDIAHETFNPYNNRRLHCLMLSVDERHRRDQRWDVPIKQIKSMWPEVLDEPINPPMRYRDKLQQFIRREIIHKYIPSTFPIYECIRYLRLKYRFARQTRENDI